MEILLYVLIGLFVLDIIIGLIFGYIDGKREAQIDLRLSWLEERIEIALSEIGMGLTDNVFPEFKDGKRK